MISASARKPSKGEPAALIQRRLTSLRRQSNSVLSYWYEREFGLDRDRLSGSSSRTRLEALTMSSSPAGLRVQITLPARLETQNCYRGR